MPTKEFLKGKQQVTLYPTIQQHKDLHQLKGDKGLNEYILDAALRQEPLQERLDRIEKLLAEITVNVKKGVPDERD